MTVNNGIGAKSGPFIIPKIRYAGQEKYTTNPRDHAPEPLGDIDFFKLKGRDLEFIFDN